jgi:hypothetical protein
MRGTALALEVVVRCNLMVSEAKQYILFLDGLYLKRLSGNSGVIKTL